MVRKRNYGKVLFGDRKIKDKWVWEDNPRFVPFDEWQEPFRYRCPECEKVSYAHTPFCPYCGIRLLEV